MKQPHPLVILAVLSFAVIGGVLIASNYNKEPSPQPTSTAKNTTDSSPQADACDVLSQDTAEAILGGASKRADTAAASATSDDIAVTTCSYSRVVSDGAATTSVTLLARVAKSANGSVSNRSQFDVYPADAQSVDGVGQAAYWKAQYGQLNILQNDNWYILSIGSADPATRTLDTTLQASRLIFVN